jgi:antitoxin component of MazEF toxin-antitoxin module
MTERKVIALKRAMYINIPADVAEKLDIVVNENLVVTVRNGSIIYSKPGYLKNTESLLGMTGEYNDSLSEMFKQETSLRCEDEDTNEEWY